MTRQVRTFLLLLLLAITAVTWFVLRELPLRSASQIAEDSMASAPESSPKPSPRRAGRAAEPPDPAWVDAARSLMDEHREIACGPYRLISDAPEHVESLCEAVVQSIEAVYVERLGVVPVGWPVGAVLAFAERDDFQAFVRRQTDLPAGYAAFTRPSRGIVAVPLGDDRRRLPQTLAHELAHLLHRRAFGPDLPPWLSEGLADAIGDSATTERFTPLAEGTGATGLATRLRGALDAGTARPLDDLLSVQRDAFDREPGHADYAHSALLVRFLLLDDRLARPFRAFLSELAAGEPFAAESLLSALGIEATQLETRFRAWLRNSAV